MNVRRNLQGQRFGRLLAIERGPNQGYRVMWRCVCDCGTECLVDSPNLVSGNTRSCGCLRDELSAARMHVTAATHRLTHTREYEAWNRMRQRCFDPNSQDYARYGGRGITVCDRWRNDAAAFYADMGPKPSPRHSIDRLNSDGPYEPGNCRWATAKEQCATRRRARHVVFEGRLQSLPDIAKTAGVPYPTLWYRIVKRHLSLAAALAK